MKVLMLNNKEINNLDERFQEGGDLVDYEIVAISWTGVAAVVVLKEKANA